MNDVLEAQIENLFARKLNIEVDSRDTDLFESGILDSMQFVELLHQLEGEFGIRIALEGLEFDDFRSIQKIAGFVANRCQRLHDSVSQEVDRVWTL